MTCKIHLNICLKQTKKTRNNQSMPLEFSPLVFAIPRWMRPKWKRLQWLKMMSWRNSWLTPEGGYHRTWETWGTPGEMMPICSSVS